MTNFAPTWFPTRDLIAAAIMNSVPAKELHVSAVKLLALDIDIALTKDRDNWQCRRDAADDMQKRLIEIVDAIKNEEVTITSKENVASADGEDECPWHTDWLEHAEGAIADSKQPEW